jgi:hypothetical protein
MNAGQVLRKQVLQLLKGGNAHLTFEQAVADFPPEHFNTHPPNVEYSFWHLLEHIRIAQWDILEFVRNPEHVSPEWPIGYWPDPNATADAEQWTETLHRFQEDMIALATMIENEKNNPTGPLAHAPDYTLLREILLVADHNAYHIGEFAVLRRVVNAW